MNLLALQALGNGSCAKAFRADGTVEGYGRKTVMADGTVKMIGTTWWRPVPAHVTSLESLYRALVRLATRPDLVVVRADLVDPAAERIRRKVHGDNAPLRDADRPWMCVDLDSTAPPAGMVVTADSAVAYLRSLLPAWLRTCGLVLQWSQSAGRDEWAKIKAHLWFWLDRTVCSASLHRWAKQHRKLIDPSVMLPVQPHYTADPIIEDGWTGRPSPSVVLFPGPPAVVPDEVLSISHHEALVVREERERAEYAERVRRSLEYTDPLAQESQAMASMRRLARFQARNIVNAGEGNRHRAIVTAVKSVAALGRELGVQHHGAMRDIAEAGRAVLPASRAHEVDEIIKAVGV
ncbi:MAG: hypothetical protein NUW01_16910 [Gemmatimonadaceae bacterium]|nr:hypothetical protein [Gemmatimonadaceae bacterium]